MAGALLDVLAKNRVSGAALSKIAEVRTDAQGRYKIKVPGGPSRLLRVAYKAYLGDNDYASRTDVSQRVKARVDFKAVTRRVSLRGTARFSGRVRGGFVPRRGKVIELQAYDAGRWRTFRTVRTNRAGTLQGELLLQARRVAEAYRFRARARYERSYPFLLGTSSRSASASASSGAEEARLGVVVAWPLGRARRGGGRGRSGRGG